MTTKRWRPCQGRRTRRPQAGAGPAPGSAEGLTGGRLPWAARHRAAGVLDNRVDDGIGLPAISARGDLARANSDHRGQDRRVEPVERGVGEPEQCVILADPLVLALPLDQLEPWRPVAGNEQHREVAAQPATLEEGPGSDAEQRRRIVLAGPARVRDRLAG